MASKAGEDGVVDDDDGGDDEEAAEDETEEESEDPATTQPASSTFFFFGLMFCSVRIAGALSLWPLGGRECFLSSVPSSLAAPPSPLLPLPPLPSPPLPAYTITLPCANSTSLSSSPRPLTSTGPNQKTSPTPALPTVNLGTEDSAASGARPRRRRGGEVK